MISCFGENDINSVYIYRRRFFTRMFLRRGLIVNDSECDIFISFSNDPNALRLRKLSIALGAEGGNAKAEREEPIVLVQYFALKKKEEISFASRRLLCQWIHNFEYET